MWNWDDWEEDPEIGELKFVIKSWDDVNSILQFRELKQRKCTPEDFGLSIADGEDVAEDT